MSNGKEGKGRMMKWLRGPDEGIQVTGKMHNDNRMPLIKKEKKNMAQMESNKRHSHADFFFADLRP